MPFALEQTAELETSIAPYILACCRDQEIRRLCRNLEDRKRSPGRRHLIPGFFVDPGQRDCNTDGGNFGEGHVDNLCSTWQRWSCLHYFFFPARMTQQQKNIKLGYNFFTVLVAWTNSSSTMRSIQHLKWWLLYFQRTTEDGDLVPKPAVLRVHSYAS